MTLSSDWNRTTGFAHGMGGACLVLLVGAGGLFAFHEMEQSLASKPELATATGKVLWVMRYGSSLYFRLSAPPGNFVQYSVGDHKGRAFAAINQSMGKDLTVEYRVESPAEPLFLDGAFHSVETVVVAGKPVNSPEQVHQSRRNNNLMMLGLALPGFLYGIVRVTWLWRRR